MDDAGGAGSRRLRRLLRCDKTGRTLAIRIGRRRERPDSARTERPDQGSERALAQESFLPHPGPWPRPAFEGEMGQCIPI